MPFPATTVIPAGWAAHHAPVAAGAQDTTCLVRGPSTGSTWDPVTESKVPTPGPTRYQGPCRVVRVDNVAGSRTQALEPVGSARYLVQLPWAARGVREGDTVHVQLTPGDLDLAGRALHVLDVTHGTHRFTRDLACELRG